MFETVDVVAINTDMNGILMHKFHDHKIHVNV